MTPRLSGHISIFGLVFFALKSLLGITRRWSREKFAILTPKPRSHIRILTYRTWAIVIQSLRSCGSEMFVLNVCISTSFPRVLETFSSTSSAISYLDSIKEEASRRLNECKVCKYSIDDPVDMSKPAVKSCWGSQLSIYLAMAYDLLWIWLLHSEILNFSQWNGSFSKRCWIYKKITTIYDWFLCPVPWYFEVCLPLLSSFSVQAFQPYNFCYKFD